jgi:hypothetical protein
MKLHHGGRFTQFPDRVYIQGNINFIDLVDIEKFSAHLLDDVLLRLGYDPKVVRYYHYLVPGLDLDFGLRALGSDADVIGFSNYVGVHKVMDVYVELETTNVHTYFCSPTKIRIEELPDNTNQPIRSSRLLLGWGESFNETGSSSVQHEVEVRVDDPNFDPFFGEPLDGNGDQMSENGSDASNLNENDEDCNSENGSDGSDGSDFIADIGNFIDDVEVDMRDFRLNIDDGVESINHNVDDHEEDVMNNEVFDSGTESDENGSSIRKKFLNQIRIEHENTSNFYLGQLFGTKDEVKKMIKELAVVSRRQLRIIKDDTKRLRAVCWGVSPTFAKASVGSSSCNRDKGAMVKNVGGRGKKANLDEHLFPWVLLVSKEQKSETWVVRTFVNDHKCLNSRDIKACTTTFLANKLRDQVQENPNIPIRAVQEQFQRQFEVGVSHMKAFRAKSLAVSYVNGDYNSQYGMLRDYVEELKNRNPDTTIKI